jgi:hypothetical protein
MFSIAGLAGFLVCKIKGAFAVTVQKIYPQPDKKPNQEANPVGRPKLGHQIKA